MTKTRLIALILLSNSFLSYAYNSQDHSQHSHTMEKSAHGLILQDGKLWAMDKHTRTLSKKMKQTFVSADHSSQASLNTLGKKLQTQLDELIAGCTMTGEAHDQLHIFLTKHIPTIKALSEANNYDSARASAIKLKGQFENYQKFFK